MFDNIIGHKGNISLLSTQIEGGALPPALLFHGPAYGGKLSTALEVARALSCLRSKAEWHCDCQSCERHRLLTHPDLLMLGARPFNVELLASKESFRRSGAAAGRFLFLRSVRKLLRRFDPVLWDEETAEGRRVLAQVAAVEDLLEALPAEGVAPDRLEKASQAVVEASAKLLDNLRTSNIPIQQIRRMAQWAHLAPAGSRKVVVLEGAEAILEGSRNALLKLLEEPPPEVTFILTTTRRGAMIPTILSRLRPYHFAQRTADEEAEVLTRIFREEAAGFASLRDYFLAWRDLNPSALRSLATRFLSLLAGASRDGGLRDLLVELGPGGGTPEGFRVFCEELLTRLRLELSAGSLDLLALERWVALVREAAEYTRLYNPNPALQLESLFYRMRAAS